MGMAHEMSAAIAKQWLLLHGHPHVKTAAFRMRHSRFCGMSTPGAGLRASHSAATIGRRDTGILMPHHTSLIAILCAGFVLAFVLRLAGATPAAVAAGRLSARRHRRRAVHAGLRRRPDAGAAAGRDRRDPADVRRRPALLAARPAGGEGDRDARRGRRRSRWPPLLGWGLALVAGLVARRRPRVRPGAVGGQHRGAAARARGAAPARDRPRPHRDRLADRRGPGDGAGAGAAAGAGRRCSAATRRRRESAACWTALCWTLAKVGAFVALMLIVGRRVIPWIARARRRHRLARAVHAVRAGDRARRRVRLGGSCSACRSRSARSSPACCSTNRSSATRRRTDSLPLRDAFAVLFFVSVGMLFDPMILVEHPLAGAGDVPDHRARQVAGGVRRSCAPSAIPTAHRADRSRASLAQIGEFSFILAGLGAAAGDPAAGGPAT